MVVETRNFRLKDQKENKLDRLAAKVNYVWNYCNATQKKHFLDHPEKKFCERFISFYDFSALTSGVSKLLKMSSGTIHQTCRRYTTSLKKAKNKKGGRKAWLRFRNAKSLRWIPFRADQIRKLKDGSFRFYTGRETIEFQTQHFENMPAEFILKDGGSFVQDSLGHWYVNLVIEYQPEKHYHQSNNTVGIDPNLSNLAALSNGRKIAAPKFYRKMDQEIAILESRAKRDENNKIISKKTQKKINKKHRKVRNQRNYYNNVESKKITDAFPQIKMGDLSSSWLLRTGRGKSALDLALYSFKQMLCYKSLRNGGAYDEVSEANTTQACSNCGEICDASPKGAKGLEIRQWTCDFCGASHDRDVNAAINIARVVPDAPGEGAGSPRAFDRSGGCNAYAEGKAAVAAGTAAG